MEQTDKDRVLQKALTPKEPLRLPSNFSYLAMRRIKEEQRKSEQRQRLWEIMTMVAVAASGIAVIVYLFGHTLWQSLTDAMRQPEAIRLVLPTLFCLFFFALLNHLLSRRYSSK